MTHEEQVLWRELRNGSIGVAFRRQAPILGYVVDFFCRELDLAVEVDGVVHDQQADHDARRDSRLGSAGIRVLRFTNDDVVNDLPSVLDDIKRVIRERSARRSRRS